MANSLFSKYFVIACYVSLSANLVAGISLDSLAFSDTQFDYLIVGGGTTGLSLAARLSEDPNVMVGVLEAGQHREDNMILIPGFEGSTLGNPDYDWLLSTTPQRELSNRSVPLGRGRVLGGTSALNFMGYARASKNEYDGWETLGNEGWNFDKLLPFMKSVENFTKPDPFFVNNFLANNDSQNHGTNGPLMVTSYANYSDLEIPFFATMASLGVEPNIASHGGDNIGVWSISTTMNPQNRSRSYAANAFYEPNSNRHNLALLTGAQVVRMHMSKDGSSSDYRATGVEYVGLDNVTRSAHSRREVVLACGAAKTPQVLELSGIGNATLLQEVGVNPIIDLPEVGESLRDQTGVSSSFQTLDNVTTWDELAVPEIAQQQFDLYVHNRTGLYSAFASTCAFMPWSRFMENDTIQRLKADLDEALSSDERFNRSSFALQRQWLDDDTIGQLEIVFFPESSDVGTGNAGSGQKFYTISLFLLHQWALGSVHITSSDGLVPPAIDLAYLQSPADVDLRVLVQALRFAMKTSQTEPMKSFTPNVIGPALNSTDDELIEWVRKTTSTSFHLAGSTPMLPREEGGVVDSSLKVYGTTNVRVVDSGIFPLHLATHPVATLYGIAERAAQIIIRSNV